jgi:ABC-type glycerol-3-phosphate transport system substrate-binding protein
MMETCDAFCDTVINPNTSKVWDKVGFAPVPGGVPLLGGWGMVINKNSANIDAAYKFLRWSTGPEVAEKSLNIAVVTPTRRDVYEKPAVKKRIPWLDAFLANFPQIRKYADAYKGGPILVPEAEYHIILGSICNEVLAGAITAEEAAKRAEREITKLLKEHGYL